MIPQVDFDIVDSILRVLEGWELGNKDLYRKYWSYIKKHKNFKILFWSREPKKMIFRIFPEIAIWSEIAIFPDFSRESIKKSKFSTIAIFPEIAISGNRNLVGLVIASEKTVPPVAAPVPPATA